MSMISRFKLEGLKKLKQPYMPKPNIANITAVSKKVKKEILASPLAFTSPASESFAKRTQKGKGKRVMRFLLRDTSTNSNFVGILKTLSDLSEPDLLKLREILKVYLG